MTSRPETEARRARISRGLLLASTLIYATSMLLPSLGGHDWNEALYGWRLFLVGLLLLFEGNFAAAWFANPAYVGAIACLLLARRGGRNAATQQRGALILAVPAVLLALSWLFMTQDPPLIGYHVWVSSMLLGCGAVLIAPRPPRPPPGLTRRVRSSVFEAPVR